MLSGWHRLDLIRWVAPIAVSAPTVASEKWWVATCARQHVQSHVRRLEDALKVSKKQELGHARRTSAASAPPEEWVAPIGLGRMDWDGRVAPLRARRGRPWRTPGITMAQGPVL